MPSEEWEIKTTVASIGSRLLDKRFSLRARHPIGIAADDAMNTATIDHYINFVNPIASFKSPEYNSVLSDLTPRS